MDILSQAVFGASTYAVAKGEATTKGDLLWGVALGMLVDADVVLGLGMNSVDALVNHRSWSHSAVFAVLQQHRMEPRQWGKRDDLTRLLATFAPSILTRARCIDHVRNSNRIPLFYRPCRMMLCMYFIPWPHWFSFCRGCGAPSIDLRIGVGLV